MSTDVAWQPYMPKHSISRATLFSLLLHISFILIIFLCDFIPAPKPKSISITTIGVKIGPISAKPSTVPKGEKRILDVTNPSPPTPAKPKPRSTPQIKPKPEVKRPALKPIPTPKTLAAINPLPRVKNAHKIFRSQNKKILATPTPDALPEPPEDQPEEQTKIADAGKSDKEGKTDSSAEDLPSIDTNYNGPKIAPKGDPNGGNVGGIPTISIEGGIVLSGEFLAETWTRIQKNFRYPSTINSRFPQPVTCVVEFRVGLDGMISEIRVRQSCGDAAVDAYATSAIEKTASLPALPTEIKEKIGKDFVTATVPFSFGGGATQ